MRETLKIQPTLAEPWLDAPYAKELQVISDLLGHDRKLAAEVMQELGPNAVSGRRGMTGDQVLRSLILKQMYGYRYEELAFHLMDSRIFRTFCGFGLTDRIPKKATLAANIERIPPKTLEGINRRLVEMARTMGIEKGRKVRIDSAKEAGLKDVVFCERRGLEVEDMAKSPWVYRRLRDFRAGMEGCISFLKRSFRMDRVTWKGLTSLKS